jgi:O-antigen ligase
VTVGFVDPLVFGYLSLAFALMMLMAISRREDAPGKSRVLVAGIAAIALGFTLSVLSGSRSGWIAIPIVVAVWLHLNVHATRRLGHAGIPLAVVLAAVVIGAASYFALPKVHQRMNEAVDDVTTYSFSGTAPVSPVGLRITYLRIAGDLIAQHPLAGVGDTSHMLPPPASQFPYANKYAVDFAFHSAFHNQVVSDAVRRGVLGGVAAALMLLVPVFIYARSLHATTAAARNNAAMGIAWGACLVVSSFSTEVVDLKYTASLYALMTAALCAGALSRHGQD